MKRLACLVILGLFTDYFVYAQNYNNTIPLFTPENKADWYVYIEAREKKDEKENRCKISWNNADFKRGFTRKSGGLYLVCASYDCEKDEYTLWRPRQPEEGYTSEGDKYITVPGDDIRTGSERSYQQYQTCAACDGDGHLEQTVYTTKTKELPGGYFSGIETKKITKGEV